jgi:hypothetical protein
MVLQARGNARVLDSRFNLPVVNLTILSQTSALIQNF